MKQPRFIDLLVNDGKYTILMDDGDFRALRHGKSWRDLTGDGLIYWLAVELQEAKQELIKLNQIKEILKEE